MTDQERIAKLEREVSILQSALGALMATVAGMLDPSVGMPSTDALDEVLKRARETT